MKSQIQPLSKMIKKILFLQLMIGMMVFTFSCSPKPVATVATAKAESSMIKPGTYNISVVDSAPKSPRKQMKGNIKGTDITVNYGSPSVKGREILNNLIPFAKVWRTGANEATTIEFSKDVKIEGKKLAAGKYGLFTLNNQGTCQVIFNTVHDQWGAYDYDKSKDVLRVKVTTVMSDENAEMMDFKIVGNAVMLVWDKLVIPFEVSKG